MHHNINASSSCVCSFSCLSLQEQYEIERKRNERAAIRDAQLQQSQEKKDQRLFQRELNDEVQKHQRAGEKTLYEVYI